MKPLTPAQVMQAIADAKRIQRELRGEFTKGWITPANRTNREYYTRQAEGAARELIWRLEDLQ